MMPPSRPWNWTRPAGLLLLALAAFVARNSMRIPHGNYLGWVMLGGAVAGAMCALAARGLAGRRAGFRAVLAYAAVGGIAGPVALLWRAPIVVVGAMTIIYGGGFAILPLASAGAALLFSRRAPRPPEPGPALASAR